MKKRVWRVLTGDSEDSCTTEYGRYATPEEANDVVAQLRLDQASPAIMVREEESEFELLGLLPINASDEEIEKYSEFLFQRIQDQMKKGQAKQ